MFYYVNLFKVYWAEAVGYAVYIQNRIVYKAVKGKIFYEMWTGRKFNFFYLQVFGSTVYI